VKVTDLFEAEIASFGKCQGNARCRKSHLAENGFWILF